MSTNETVYIGRDLEGMSFAPAYNRWILESLEASLGDRIAEIGAGCGNLTRLLAADPRRQITALEPSDNMYPRLAVLQQQYPNLQTCHGYLADRAEMLADSFDSALYINVLEHVENDQHELELVHGILRPGGKVIIFVPALSFLYSRFDRLIGHFRRYHKQGLVDLVAGSGFRVEQVRYFDITGIIPWYINFVLLKAENIGRSVVLYDRLVVPVMKRLENLVAPPVGKNLLLIARKI